MSILTTLKKPLNALDNPVYPDIAGPAPRFYNTGKHWTVDVGKTMSQIEYDTNRLDYAILAQSRDYNQTVYGKSSSKDVVNEAFRPPLITLEDTLPLNRIPREQTVPRINPGTKEYKMQARDTELLSEFTSTDNVHFTTEKVKHGYGPPRFYKPMALNTTLGAGIGGVVPDMQLQLKRPSASSTTNKKISTYTNVQPDSNIEGFVSPKILDSIQASATSGYNGEYSTDLLSEDWKISKTKQDEKIRKASGVIVGKTLSPQTHLDSETHTNIGEHTTKKSSTSISATSGKNPGFIGGNMEEHPRPQNKILDAIFSSVFSGAYRKGVADPHTFHGSESQYEFVSKVPHTSITTIPSSKFGSEGVGDMVFVNTHLENKSPMFSAATAKSSNLGPAVGGNMVFVDTHLENKSPMFSAKSNPGRNLDFIDRSSFVDKKLEKDSVTSSTSLVAHKQYKLHLPTEHVQPHFRKKTAMAQSTNYQTKGFIPKAGPTIGNGKGLGYGTFKGNVNGLK